MYVRENKFKPLDFLAQHPVFTHREFLAAYGVDAGRSRYTANNLLAHHEHAGHLARIRRGLYASIPRGLPPDATPLNPYLIATKLADDAVVAYHAVLQYYGKAYSVSNRYTYLTHQRSRSFRFRNMEFVPVLVPRALRARHEGGGGVKTERHAGGMVRVATLDHTLVDVLHAPEYGGGWEEIWRSLEAVEFFDLDAVVTYARALGSALTAARVGFFLEQHREALLVEEKHLDALQSLSPKQPRYFDSRREVGQFIARWNMIVPERIRARTWAEVA